MLLAVNLSTDNTGNLAGYIVVGILLLLFVSFLIEEWQKRRQKNKD